MTLLDALEFKPLSPQAAGKSKNAIIESIHFHPKRKDREAALLRQILSDAAKSNTLITTVHAPKLKILGRLGLLAMSVGKLEIDKESYPAVVIDFLLVDHRYRSQSFGDDGMKISEAFLYFALYRAKEITELAAARYLILRPDGGKKNTKLVAFYTSIQFRYMTKMHEWMYLKLQ